MGLHAYHLARKLARTDPLPEYVFASIAAVSVLPVASAVIIITK